MSVPDADVFRMSRPGGHELHIERHGARGGIPTVVLHGGPGAGLSQAALRTFDLDRHEIILFDQRGCGQSTPLGALADNTTQDLIGDIEAIRRHFGYDRWMVVGGSWGSCLGLAYAQAHPERVSAMRLHGIFLAGDADVDWWFQGVAAVFPDHWEIFAGHVGAEERGDLLSAYHRRLTSETPEEVEAAAWHLRNFSARTQTFEPDEAHIANLLSAPAKYVPVAKLFAQYCKHRAYLPKEGLLAGIDRHRHIPTEILQGRYDMTTPVRSAWALHKAWPEARFSIVTLTNHTAAPAMIAAQREATTRLADQIEALAFAKGDQL